MAKRREDDAPPGAPEWMLTFSDCMTLLLTFFVLLTSFATFDDETIPELGEAFARAIPGVGLLGASVEKTMVPKNIGITDPLQEKGSETRTLAHSTGKNFMREKKPLDFKNLKVFSIDSEKIFWGQGIALTQPGQESLKMLEKFFLNTPGRIVISENGPGGNSSLGMERAMMVMEYFAAGGINKNRLNISASPTTKDIHSARQLQITLLERSAYE
jgi:flagellar motor protein MotB